MDSTTEKTSICNNRFQKQRVSVFIRLIVNIFSLCFHAVFVAEASCCLGCLKWVFSFSPEKSASVLKTVLSCEHVRKVRFEYLVRLFVTV